MYLVKKLFILSLSCLFLISLLLTACNDIETTPTQASTSTSASNTESENWFDKFGEPEYGDTLYIRTDSLPTVFDPYATNGGGGPWLESTGFLDWAIDRDVWDFSITWTPVEYMQGLLAESWEITDPVTMKMKLHEGIYWHDKAPVNGREFTAEDLQFNYERIMGTGSGSTEPSPYFGSLVLALEKVVATDTYTVEYVFKEPIGPLSMTTTGVLDLLMVPSEWVEDNNMDKWENAVGTGAWELTDYVSGSSMTLSANSRYYGYDERYPKNQLPYLNEVKVIQIADSATSLASIRSGQIDMMITMQSGLGRMDGQSLAKSNPEIEQKWLANTAGALLLRCDLEPFTDVNVRKAMQMAIDVQSIGDNYYTGTSDGKPVGMVTPVLEGWTLHYDDWSSELQQEYTYNPERAKELITAAGYPDGFEFVTVAASTHDLEVLEIMKSYYSEIDVEMEIMPIDMGAFIQYLGAGKGFDSVYHEGLAGMLFAPSSSFNSRLASSIPAMNQTYNYDYDFDALVDEMKVATTTEEAQQYSREAEIYALEQHWSVNLCQWARPIVWQPYVKGYSGEKLNGINAQAPLLARLWINQEVKKSMK